MSTSPLWQLVPSGFKEALGLVKPLLIKVNVSFSFWETSNIYAFSSLKYSQNSIQEIFNSNVNIYFQFHFLRTMFSGPSTEKVWNRTSFKFIPWLVFGYYFYSTRMFVCLFLCLYPWHSHRMLSVWQWSSHYLLGLPWLGFEHPTFHLRGERSNPMVSTGVYSALCSINF